MQSWRVCLVLLVGFAACDNKRDAPKPEAKPEAKPEVTQVEPDPAVPRPADPPKPADPFADWTERKGDGFSVLAPQEPKVQTKETAATGKPLPTTMYTHYAPDGPGAIQVMFTELGKDAKLDARTMFDAMKASMVKQFGATVTKHQMITIGTAKGEEYWLDGAHPQMGKMAVHVKFLLHERRLYLVQGLWAADAADFGAQADKFVDSFKLL